MRDYLKVAAFFGIGTWAAIWFTEGYQSFWDLVLALPFFVFIYGFVMWLIAYSFGLFEP